MRNTQVPNNNYYWNWGKLQKNKILIKNQLSIIFLVIFSFGFQESLYKVQ